MQKRGVITKNLRLDRRDIAYVKYILEGHEGLVTVTTIDKSEAVVQLSIVPDFHADVDEILESLKGEINMSEIDGEGRR